MIRSILAFLLTAAIPLAAQVPARVYAPDPAGNNTTGLSIIVFQGRLYYIGYTPATNMELFSYDGVSAGPVIHENVPGRGMGVTSNTLMLHGGNIYFDGATPGTGPEPTSFDGRSFKVLSDITPGAAGSRPRAFTALSPTGPLFFAADSSDGSMTARYELYSYDGTNPPKRIRVNNTANPVGSSPGHMQALKGKMYFSATTDTTLYTRLLCVEADGTVTPAKGATRLRLPGEKVLIEGRLYFKAMEPGTGFELYSYDGDTAIRLTDLAPGPLHGMPPDTFLASVFSYASTHILYRGRIYFGGSSDGASYQLYAYDRATGTASLIHTIYPGGDAQIANFYIYKNDLYFTAYTPSSGTELWKYDGVTCALYADIWPGRTGGLNAQPNWTYYRMYAGLTEFKGDLYFMASDSLHGRNLWRIKAAATGVEQVGAGAADVCLHPNPAVTTATLDLNLPQRMGFGITILDMNGRQVYAAAMKNYEAGPHQLVLPLQHLHAGLYAYRVNDSSGRCIATGTLIKQ